MPLQNKQPLVDCEIGAGQVYNLYHEQQVGRLCGLHCLNNILQSRVFEATELRKLEKELTKEQNGLQPWWRTRIFRSLLSFFTGDDFNVQTLEVALRRKGLAMKWFDRRIDIHEIDLQDPNLVGLIVNIEEDEPARLCRRRSSDRHWFSVCRVGLHEFVNLDSRLEKPTALGNVFDVLLWLSEVLLTEESCVFRVTSSEEVSSPRSEELQDNLAYSEQPSELEMEGSNADIGKAVSRPLLASRKPEVPASSQQSPAGATGV